MEPDGYELWKTDGTSSGTTMVKDINSGYFDYQKGVVLTIGILERQQQLYFFADDGTSTEI